MKSRVIVVGGGAAGMMAAATAASRGIDTLLLEKNDILGKKIYITGNGRCNLTNSCSVDEIIKNTPGNGVFLYSALNAFSHEDIRRILMQMGVPTKVEKGNRVFPVSDKSGDVVRALEEYAKKCGAKVMLNCAVSEIKIERGRAKGVYAERGQLLEASSVIVATGGLSYPSTGSTGDGYRWAARAGHEIIPLRPSLVPVETGEDWVRDLQGLSLKDVRVQALTSTGKRIREERGEMLFTHFGLSGPIILTISRFIYEYLKEGVILIIDLKPQLDSAQLDNFLLSLFRQGSNKKIKNALKLLLPQRIVSVLLSKTGISKQRPINQITREERKRLVEAIKRFDVKVKGLRPVKEAIITAGGVSTREVDPSSMESRLVKGLFFAGEVLDVDALTGGFNLQIAFSTGYLAGISCW